MVFIFSLFREVYEFNSQILTYLHLCVGLNLKIMKFKLFSLLILFFAFLRRNDSKPSYIEQMTTEYTASTATNIPPSVHTTTSTPSQENYLDNISIQDVLSSDIDASEKIEKKIINTVTEYSANCRTYKKIDISIEDFSFPQNSVTIDLDIANATFYHIAAREFRELTESSEHTRSEKRKSYSTLIGCDSSRNAKIELKLPNDIEISAYLRVVGKTNNATNEINAISATLGLSEGDISFKLKNNALSKQFSMQTNSTNIEDNIISKILYTKSEVSLNIDTKFQMLIYNKLQTFFDKVELPIREFLVQKLNNYLNSNGISVSDSCSKFVNPDKNSKKINLPFLNTNLNHLYVIPDAKLDTWRKVPLSAGPIVIDGLADFNSTEFIATESEISSPDSNGKYYSTPSPYDDPEMKEITIRIKTNDLKGKLDWSYNFKKRSFPFSVEFIQFEIKKTISFSYVSVENNHNMNTYNRFYDERSTSSSRYIKSNQERVDVNVYLGNLLIKSTNSKICENESEFVNFVLSEYLKTVIANSLQILLNKKLQNESPFANCN
ncbi:uncharacterized protein LOC135839169 isoform X1 [Planococcus citri]|uniref:uncharacterized protein LOC135839169 isoform X1 n=1 Tax=Planococcus citri TaxID=170843 RepID=UPI0031F883CB